MFQLTGYVAFFNDDKGKPVASPDALVLLDRGGPEVCVIRGNGTIEVVRNRMDFVGIFPAGTVNPVVTAQVVHPMKIKFTDDNGNEVVRGEQK